MLILLNIFRSQIKPGDKFVIFGVVHVPGIFFVWRYVPETKGKSLEEIEKIILKRTV